MARTLRTGVRPVRTVIGYTRVSTEQQAVSGAGLEAQRAKIVADAQRLGVEVVAWYADEGISGGKFERDGLQSALNVIVEGGADGLMYAEGSRLTRDIGDWSALMDMSKHYGFALIRDGERVDTNTSSGFLREGMDAVLAHHYRLQVSERTRAALAALKARGVRLGGPVEISDEATRMILDMRRQGLSMAKIAGRLNADGVATARGGTWYASTVAVVLNREGGCNA